MDPRIDELFKRVKILEKKLVVVVEAINNHVLGGRLGGSYLDDEIKEAEALE